MFDVPQLLLGHFYSNIPTVKQEGTDMQIHSGLQSYSRLVCLYKLVGCSFHLNIY